MLMRRQWLTVPKDGPQVSEMIRIDVCPAQIG